MDVEQIMEQVCDRCHWPYVESQEDLEERCEACPIYDALKRLAGKEE